MIKVQCRLSTWPIIQTGLPRLTLKTRKKGHCAVSSVCFAVSRLMLRPDPINFNVYARVLPYCGIKSRQKSNDLSSTLVSGFVFAVSSTRQNFFLANSRSIAPAVATTIFSSTVSRQFKLF